MKNKLAFVFAGLFTLIMLINFVSSADIAYIVTSASFVQPKFVESMNELGLTYTVILASNVSNQNFSNFKMILLNDEYFSNSGQIPINQVPSLLVNGRNMDDWGWTTRLSTLSWGTPLHVMLNKTYEVTTGLNETMKAYTIGVTPDVYYLDHSYIYSGIKAISYLSANSNDVVVGLAKKGTNLTKTGKPNTIVSADTIFFGIKDTAYWTEDTKTLFKNCLMYLQTQDSYTLSLSSGINLISIPMAISEVNAGELIAANPEIVYIKDYNGTDLADSDGLISGKGYFIKTSAPLSLDFSGINPRSAQSLSLSEGMNLIGLNLLSAKSFSSLNIPSDVIEISKRNSDGTYTRSTKYGVWWFNSFSIEPGKAYWIKASNAAVWSYDP